MEQLKKREKWFYVKEKNDFMCGESYYIFIKDYRDIIFHHLQ